MDKIKPFKKIVLWVRDNFQPKSHKIELGPNSLTSGKIDLEHDTDSGVDLVRVAVEVPVRSNHTTVSNAAVRSSTNVGTVFVPSYICYDNVYSAGGMITFHLVFPNISLKLWVTGTYYNSLYDAMVAELANGCIIEYTLS